MSESKAKAKRKTEHRQLIEDLEQQLDAATKAQEAKLTQSRDHLVGQLRMASTKYLTVNGYMQARSTLDSVLFGEEVPDPDGAAKMIAIELSSISAGLAKTIEETGFDDLDESILDGLLDEDFVSKTITTPGTVTRQLMIVGLLQNVGPVLDDFVQFRSSTDEAIQKIKDELAAQMDTEKEQASGTNVVQIGAGA